MRVMHVAIDARLPDSGQGGVLQVLRVLGLAFQDPTIPPFQRTWVVYEGTTWWKETIPEGDRILEVPPPFGGVALKVAARFPRLISFAYPLLRRLQSDRPEFDEQLRGAGVELVHLPFQDGFSTDLPFLYNPHDLQHHYFPENFSASQLRHRETVWRRRATAAQVVMAASFAVRDDLVRFWNIGSETVRVVPIPPPNRVAPPTPSDESLRSIHPYCIYPAVYWPHKNHLRLIEAVGVLQLEGYVFDVVLTGAEAGIFREVQQAVALLPDPERIRFAGHVSNSDLSWLIANSLFMVVPSLFEAMSLTVWDGQRLGTPVACSSVTPFPDQVGDTALIFDPFDPSSIADTMRRLLVDECTRSSLIERAHQRVAKLTNRNYAMAMYGVYCELAGRSVSDEALECADELRAIISRSEFNG